MPSTSAGTSIDAFSLSSVISESFFLTRSPALTSTSMTGTSLKSPMSGTRTSIASLICTAYTVIGLGLLGSISYFWSAFLDGSRRNRSLVGERLQCRERDEMAVDFEEFAQFSPEVAASVTVGAECDVTPARRRDEFVRQTFGCSRWRRFPARPIAQALLDVRTARRLLRMQHVPAPRRDAVALEFVEARYAPHVRLHVPLAGKQVGRCYDFAKNSARPKKLHAAARSSHAWWKNATDTFRGEFRRERRTASRDVRSSRS